MSNMSYCMFQNTVSDLRDALRKLEEMTPEEFAEESKAEQSAARALYGLCQDYADAYEQIVHYLSDDEGED